MKIKLHSRSAFLGSFLNFKKSISLLLLLFTMSSFCQNLGIEFDCVGAGLISFNTPPNDSFNGKVSWSNGVDFNDTPGYTLRFEVDNTWSVRAPNGPRFFFSSVDGALPSCSTTDWERDLGANGSFCQDVGVTCITGSPEVCDGMDNDGDGDIDEDLPVTTYYVDADGDGYGTTEEDLCSATAPAGYATVGGDCDDTNTAINPGATESCHDADDNDCDGFTDEDDAACGEVISYCNADQTKILICHNGKNKCVQENALDAHLAHGDTLGSCDGDPYEGELYTKSAKGKTESSIIGFTTRVWPNPSENNFNVKITTTDNLNGVDVQVIDVTGKQVHNAYINWNENYKFGSKLESGIYFVKFIQGKNTQVKKVIKR